MNSPRVMVATPVPCSVPHTGTVSQGFHISSLRLFSSAPMTIDYTPGHAYTNTDLVRARSRAVRFALDRCATHLLFWDSDVFGDAAACLRGMLDAGVDFIAAPYPRKNGTGRSTHEAPCVAMGFTLLSERCLRRMWDEYYDELHFEDVVEDKPHRTVALFQLLMVEMPTPWPHRVLLSEDYSFCERWLRLGGEISLYEGPGAPLQHVGARVYKMGESA